MTVPAKNQLSNKQLSCSWPLTFIHLTLTLYCAYFIRCVLQRFFLGHDDDILSLAIHPDRTTVATGQVRLAGRPVMMIAVAQLQLAPSFVHSREHSHSRAAAGPDAGLGRVSRDVGWRPWFLVTFPCQLRCSWHTFDFNGSNDREKYDIVLWLQVGKDPCVIVWDTTTCKQIQKINQG